MEVSNNINIKTLQSKSLSSLPKKEEKVDLKVNLKIEPKDFIKIDTSSKNSTDIFKFLDDYESFKISKPNLKDPDLNIKLDKPVDNSKIKSIYDDNKKIATITSTDDKISTKTVFDEKDQSINTELITKEKDSSIKFIGGYNTKDAKIKPLGIESNDKDTTVKALYDPQRANLSGEIKQNIDGQGLKVKSEYNLKSPDKNGKVGLEYSISGIKINTDYSNVNSNKDVNLKLEHEQIELTTNFDANKNLDLKSVQIAKPIKFGDNLPTAKFSIDYDNQKNNFKKVGVDLNANITKEVSVTFSSNLAQSVKQHSVKLNYDVYNNTKVSLEGNLNGVDTSKSGYKISFSSGFKF
ncbi:MAG: hypothetical protein U0354_14780 [Candidatus Sericytochromatia bacterium]